MAIFTQTDTRVFAAASSETIHTLLNLLPLIRQIDPDSFPLASIGKRVGVPDWAAEDYREDNAPLAFKVAPTKIAPPQTDSGGCGSIFAGLPNFLIRDIILRETERKREEEARKKHAEKFQASIDIIARCEDATDPEWIMEEWGQVCPYTVGEQIIHLIAIDNDIHDEHRRKGWINQYPYRYHLDTESYYGYWTGEFDNDSDWDFLRNRYTNHNLP